MIPNPGLGFRNYDFKIKFWANLGPKIQTCPLSLEIGAHSVSKMLILNLDLDFGNSNWKIHFWANLGPKIPTCLFRLKLVHKVCQG